MDTAVREYPELVQEYFGTIIPPGDKKVAALNSAVWSGGAFIYVPKGVHIEERKSERIIVFMMRI